MLRKLLSYKKSSAFTWLIALLLAMLSPGNNFPKTPSFPFKDKIIHFGLFFVLVILWLRVANSYSKQDRLNINLFTTYLVFGIIFAILVEYLQRLVPNRSFDYYDIAANMLGGAVGIICFYILYKKKSKLV